MRIGCISIFLVGHTGNLEVSQSLLSLSNGCGCHLCPLLPSPTTDALLLVLIIDLLGPLLYLLPFLLVYFVDCP